MNLDAKEIRIRDTIEVHLVQLSHLCSQSPHKQSEPRPEPSVLSTDAMFPEFYCTCYYLKFILLTRSPVPDSPLTPAKGRLRKPELMGDTAPAWQNTATQDTFKMMEFGVL